MVEYAIYKGDEFLFIDTLEECAKRLKIKPASVRYLVTNVGKRRFESRKDKSKAMTAVKLEDEDDE